MIDTGVKNGHTLALGLCLGDRDTAYLRIEISSSNHIDCGQISGKYTLVVLLFAITRK